jgi:hypothetical protein
MTEPLSPAELERIEGGLLSHHGVMDCDVRKLIAEVRRLRTALEKIDAIRNDIIGRQNINWSRHIYPLVAALGEAGFEGTGYEVAREKAKQEIDWLRANPDRAAAYQLVESEMRACGLVELHRSDAGHNRPGTQYIRNASWTFEGEYVGSSRPTAFVKTLIEAVDKLRGDGRGENENG